MNDEDGRWSWHDQRGVTWAAGAAAVALIVILVWAVIRVSNGSPLVPDFEQPVPSQATFEGTSTSRTTSTTTSYPRPSAQTTELNPVPAPTQDPVLEDPATTSTSTTTTNPYVTTTTQNGGAV